MYSILYLYQYISGTVANSHTRAWCKRCKWSVAGPTPCYMIFTVIYMIVDRVSETQVQEGENFNPCQPSEQCKCKQLQLCVWSENVLI